MNKSLFFGLLRLHIEADRILEPKLSCFIYTLNLMVQCSNEPGTLGGHCLLKIYGKLDCCSATRYLKNGGYKQHRVFFRDEETAIKAGYRPCSKCMREEYVKWKGNNKTKVQ